MVDATAAPLRNFTLIAGATARRLPVRRMRMLEDRAIGTDLVLLDVCGRRRSSATMSLARKGKKPANYGKRYYAEPLTPDEFLAILDRCGPSPAHVRLRALLVVLYRADLRISEALDLYEPDIDAPSHTVTVKCGKGGKRRIVGIDDWGLDQLEPWLAIRPRYPYGPLFCIVEGPTRGNRMSSPWVRTTLKRLAAECGIDKNVRPHQLRHSLACDLARDGIPVPLISRQLGHSNIATTSTYLAGIAPVEVTNVMAARLAPGAVMALPAPGPLAPCQTCEGSGRLNGGRNACGNCAGTGRVTLAEADPTSSKHGPQEAK